ncbi:MAG: hypothetical protein JWN39_2335, partial [Ilumatobacteraceae bacterium]|nr:hypothetical protein [Ilumatobacteraceae bacterium]
MSLTDTPPGTPSGSDPVVPPVVATDPTRVSNKGSSDYSAKDIQVLEGLD